MGSSAVGLADGTTNGFVSFTAAIARALSGHGQGASASVLGFLVTSASIRFLAGNQEAAAILTYPGRQTAQSASDGFEKRLRQGLLRLSSRSNGHESPPTIQIKSGRRTYFCRTFVLKGERTPDGASVLVVLERRVSRSGALSQVLQQFRLAPREQQAVTLVLLQGLCNKEIAERLKIGVNTVEAFLRTVMIKMGVSSRCEIMSKVLGSVLAFKPD